MPMPPATGDQGQRYKIEAEGWPKPGCWNVIGYAETSTSAQSMASGIAKAPGVTDTRITDRKPTT